MNSILDCVRRHAEERPDAVCVELFSKRKPGGRRTFGEIQRAAMNAASFYAAHAVKPGDLVVLIGTHHLDFYAAWLGAVWCGAVPTVLAEPSVRIDRSIYLERLTELLGRVDAKVVAVDPSVDVGSVTGVSVHPYPALAEASGAPPQPHRARPEDLALLQHSSGTTGLQKGVMLSHGALSTHAEAYGAAIEATGEDVVASWLPLYHDMGLIACFVMPLFVGMKVVWLSPFEWVANPSLLLDAIAQHRATLAWLPNFAFPFLAQRTRQDYDLSSLRAVVNCSEPVSEPAMQTFATRFASLDPNALHTCYALAENVFAVSTTRRDSPRRILHVDRKSWLEQHRAVDASSQDGLELVSNGTCIAGCAVEIAGDAGERLPERTGGRVLIRSPFLFDGYFRRSDLDPGLFDGDGWFDTGDVGFLDELGHLYVTGRKKDLIIVGGRNIYPQDVEQAAERVDGVHPGRVVCFGVSIAALGTEGLIVLAESDAPESDWPSVARGIKAAAASRLDIDVLDARIVPSKSLRKSTSGKLARSGNRDWYLEGRFGALPKSLEQ